MLKNLLVVFVLLTACSTVPPPTAPTPDAPPTPDVPVLPNPPSLDCVTILKSVESTCPKAGTVQGVDLSTPVDQKFLNVARCLGVKLVIRYGDYVNETIRGKTPKPAELELIKKNGLDFLAIFQHNNSKITSFTAARGEADAKRMLELYPKAPAFYFGADGEFHTAANQTAVKTYAIAFAKVARANGKKVGVYGSGLTLKNLQDAGITDYHWLANATGWTGSKSYSATGKWVMQQGLPKNCGGKNVDFNVFNPKISDIGSWKL